MVIAISRTIVLYLILIVGFRMLGKHQVGELEPAEFVLTLLLADIASVPMQDFGIPLLSGVIPIITLLCTSMILSVLCVKSLKIRNLLSGKSSIVIREGRPEQKEMRRTRMTLDELSEELRLQGYTSFKDIKYAILETNGQLSILPYAKVKPPGAEDLCVDVKEPELPVVIINDGRLLKTNLYNHGLNEEWLRKFLKERKINSIKDVFYLTVTKDLQTYLIRKELKS